MTTIRNASSWFEIPVHDLARAVAFYETLLGTPLRRENIAGSELGVFGHDESGVGGCLMAGGAQANVALPPCLTPGGGNVEDISSGCSAPSPSAQGTLVYLNAGAALDPVLARVEAAGGRITMPKVQLPGDMGCFAHIADTEGNRVGLHALS